MTQEQFIETRSPDWEKIEAFMPAESAKELKEPQTFQRHTEHSSRPQHGKGSLVGSQLVDRLNRLVSDGNRILHTRRQALLPLSQVCIQSISTIPRNTLPLLCRSLRHFLGACASVRDTCCANTVCGSAFWSLTVSLPRLKRCMTLDPGTFSNRGKYPPLPTCSAFIFTTMSHRLQTLQGA